MQQLAALLPRPRLRLFRLYGVLEPNAQLCAQVVSARLQQATGESELDATEPGCANGRPARSSGDGLLRQVLECGHSYYAM